MTERNLIITPDSEGLNLNFVNEVYKAAEQRQIDDVLLPIYREKERRAFFGASAFVISRLSQGLVLEAIASLEDIKLLEECYEKLGVSRAAAFRYRKAWKTWAEMRKADKTKFLRRKQPLRILYEAVPTDDESDPETNGAVSKKQPAKKKSKDEIKVFEPEPEEPVAEETAAGEPAEEYEEVEWDPEEEMQSANSEIEKFCRALVKFYKDNIPDDPWITETRAFDSGLSNLKMACTSVKLAKGVRLCVECEGEGCEVCHDTGRFPRSKLLGYGLVE